MIWIILYVVSAFVYYAIDCGRMEKLVRPLNSRNPLMPKYKVRYFKLLLEAIIWPVYLIFDFIRKLAGGN